MSYIMFNDPLLVDNKFPMCSALEYLSRVILDMTSWSSDQCNSRQMLLSHEKIKCSNKMNGRHAIAVTHASTILLCVPCYHRIQ